VAPAKDVPYDKTIEPLDLLGPTPAEQEGKDTDDAKDDGPKVGARSRRRRPARRRL
jgi:hypothetical protein